MDPAFIIFILFMFVVSVYTLAPLYLNSREKLAARRLETGGEAHRQEASVMDWILKIAVSAAGMIVLSLFILMVFAICMLSFDAD